MSALDVIDLSLILVYGLASAGLGAFAMRQYKRRRIAFLQARLERATENAGELAIRAAALQYHLAMAIDGDCESQRIGWPTQN